jgi:tetratricopeptide (TPR) repeat protein
MSIDQFMAQIEAAKDDPTRLALITLDAVLASREQTTLRPVVEAAAIPHWFDAKLLACCMEADGELSDNVEGVIEKLCALPMVEPFAARGGWNVHARTRLALRDYLQSTQSTDPDRFRRLSSRAVHCFDGDAPHLRIEALYHLLVAEPQQGADSLRQLWLQWDAAGRHEALQSLAIVLEELIKNQALASAARAQCVLRFCMIRGESLPAQQTGALCREVQILMTDGNNAADQCDYVNLVGQALERQGQLGRALDQYRRQMDICDAEVRRDPDSAHWRRELSVAHNFVGRVLQAQGKLPEALAEYQAYQGIMQDLTARDPDNPGWGSDLSVSYNNVGAVLQAQGRLAEALAEYQADMRIMQKLTARDPDNADWRHGLSVSHYCIGRVLETQNKWPEALAEYEAYKRIMQDLTARDPDNAGWQRDLSISHNCVGTVLQTQGKWPEALAEYQADKRIMQELAARDPDNADWLRGLCVSHNRVGRVLAAQGKQEEAEAEYEVFRRILQELTARYPDIPFDPYISRRD